MGPDFLCIGLQKAGTRWLYDQFSNASGVWMPPIKEIGYFDRRSFKPGNMEILKSSQRRLRFNRHYFLDQKFYNVFGRGLSPAFYTYDWYLSLFLNKGGNISGDITPGYSMLSDEEVTRVAELLPETPVLLLLRHPVDRVKSALSMYVRRGRISQQDITSVEGLDKIMCNKYIDKNSFPSRIWQRWVKYFGSDRCRYFFLQEIHEQPEQVRERIAGFINLKNPKFRLPADFNQKSNNKRYDFSVEAEHFLYEHFKEEILRCKELFKGYALDWKTQV